jgi:hypothetical protein
MSEVVEPAVQGSIDSVEGEFQGIARFAGSQFAEAVYDLSVAFLSWEAKLPANRVA